MLDKVKSYVVLLLTPIPAQLGRIHAPEGLLGAIRGREQKQHRPTNQWEDGEGTHCGRLEYQNNFCGSSVEEVPKTTNVNCSHSAFIHKAHPLKAL